MVKRKCQLSAEEQATDHQRRAQKHRSRAAYQEVIGILNKFPKASPSALSHLKDLGYDINKPIEEMPKSAAALSTEARTANRKTATCPSHMTLPDIARDFPPEELVPPKIDSLEDFTVSHLAQQLLQHIEPGSLSTSNFRAMPLRGAIDSTKAEYLRLVEFTTGLEKAANLTGAMRVWRIFRDHTIKLNKWRGRRARDCQLPDDWPNRGLYSVTVNTELEVLVTINRTSVSAKIPANKLPVTFDASAMHLEFNWSELRCKLYFVPGLAGPSFSVLELFPTIGSHILPEHMDEYKAWQRDAASTLNTTRAIEDIKLSTPQTGVSMLAIAAGFASDHGSPQSLAPLADGASDRLASDRTETADVASAASGAHRTASSRDPAASPAASEAPAAVDEGDVLPPSPAE